MLQFPWLLIVVAVSGVSAEIPQNDCDVEVRTKHPPVVSIKQNGTHLVTSLKFGENVHPIEISEVEELSPDAKLQMVGWNMTNRGGKETACLKEATLNIADRDNCQTLYQEKTLTESEFCTQPVGDVCKGDKGSPLIYENKLVGVATHGISCKQVPIPDVHPNMYKNIKYLYEIMGK